MHIKDSEGGPNAEMFCSLRINLHNLSIFVTFHYILYKSIIQVYICCVIITCLSSFPETISFIRQTVYLSCRFRTFSTLILYESFWVLYRKTLCVCVTAYFQLIVCFYMCVQGSARHRTYSLHVFKIIIYVCALYISPLNKQFIP